MHLFQHFQPVVDLFGIIYLKKIKQKPDDRKNAAGQQELEHRADQLVRMERKPAQIDRNRIENAHSDRKMNGHLCAERNAAAYIDDGRGSETNSDENAADRMFHKIIQDQR